METVQEIIQRLSQAGLKVTPQRVAVMQALFKLHHPRADEIFREVSQNLPGLSPTTVYNVLDVLVNKEIIRKVKTEADVMRYDAMADHHHHMYCTQSDRMEDYVDPELDQLLSDYFRKKDIKGFKLKEIKLQIMGEFEKPLQKS